MGGGENLFDADFHVPNAAQTNINID